MADEAKVKKPISEKQRLANIANAQKSTGPRTDAGKTYVSGIALSTECGPRA